jgi:DNA-binding MarR family transcriptional regulator
MTTLVRLVEREGVMERRRDSDDGRAILVYLTGRGRWFRPIAEQELLWPTRNHRALR